MSLHGSALLDTVTLLATYEYDVAAFQNNFITMPKESNAAVVMFYGTDAANEAATMGLYGRAAGNGPILTLWTGVVTLGARVVTKDPMTGLALTAYWADTITNTLDEGPFEVVLRNEGADDTDAMMILDLPGIKDVHMKFTTKTSVASIGGILLPIFHYVRTT